MAPSDSNDEFDRNRWENERAFRERELSVAERRLDHEIQQASVGRESGKKSQWSSPMVIAIFAAAVAATGNAMVSLVEGYQDRQLETEKAEQARILEMIKTGDPDSAATNLEFILDAGLVEDPKVIANLRNFLRDRKPGTGPVLNSPGPIARGIVGADDAVKVSALSLTHPVRSLARSVGRLDIRSSRGAHVCTAFLVESAKIVTAGHCLSDLEAATFQLFPELSVSGEVVTIEVDVASVSFGSGEGVDQVAFLDLAAEADDRFAPLATTSTAPQLGSNLGAIYFRGGQELLAVWDTKDCQLLSIDEELIHHLCDTGAGASGSPIFESQSRRVIGVHTRRSGKGGIATRLEN